MHKIHIADFVIIIITTIIVTNLSSLFFQLLILWENSENFICTRLVFGVKFGQP